MIQLRAGVRLIEFGSASTTVKEEEREGDDAEDDACGYCTTDYSAEIAFLLPSSSFFATSKGSSTRCRRTIRRRGDRHRPLTCQTTTTFTYAPAPQRSTRPRARRTTMLRHGRASVHEQPLVALRQRGVSSAFQNRSVAGAGGVGAEG